MWLALRGTLNHFCWRSLCLLVSCPLLKARTHQLLGSKHFKAYTSHHQLFVTWGLVNCKHCPLQTPLLLLRCPSHLLTSCIPVTSSIPETNHSQISLEDLRLLLAIPHPVQASIHWSLCSAITSLSSQSRQWHLCSVQEPVSQFSTFWPVFPCWFPLPWLLTSGRVYFLSFL